MLEFLRPVEHFNRSFDRGMILCEFQALREPEATRFPQIGAWLRAKGVAFNEIPTPSMYWRGKLWPDLYIANQLEAVPDSLISERDWEVKPENKSSWPDGFSLASASRTYHGVRFHEAFIEPMCGKITGLPSSEIAAKYHRAIWLPLYWPQTLRARASIRTPFYYPAAGYAGKLAECLDISLGDRPRTNGRNDAHIESIGVNLAYVVATPRRLFSTMFIVDDSPIYRVTDMDGCAKIMGAEFHRFVVEYRGECNVVQELERMGLTYHARHMAFDSLRLTLPTIKNVAAGWRPRPNMNTQLWEHINAESHA